MSFAASRALVRQSRFAIRRAGMRNASTTSEAAGAAKEKAGDAASKVQSKASEGLTKVKSSAESAASSVSTAASNAAGTVNSAAGKAQGRVGRLVGAVQGLIPQATYYGRVGLELGKLIVKQRSMAPPSVQTIQGYLQPALNALRHPASIASSLNPNTILSQVRGASSAQYWSAGVVAAEVLGFFSIGEVIGRFKLVGYREKGHGGDGEAH
ncbi:mitochondrial ATP synthase g subunit-domain-containing protein [Boeremia exigua]|uniref:mitochondrial ATP synthase g subunit-domain-containing protein n=1 Tax=Boeremia exigua TaxID=749465 RepID=UPI001E8EA1D0|nr:mitochondrial ATP synthase g subunit-domain-containing protein [Boeremia exigua]KAH6643149.1 mitochondrial ATP synthase g subunit-domain-containing protein [Boeremia exigua]